jgi:hypothetical protein
LLTWIIYYSDGTTFSSEEGTWLQAPGRDVQIILYHHPRHGWIMRHGGNTRKGDFFRIDDGHVVGMDLTGVIDHVVHQTGEIKEGRMLNPDHWQQILRTATLRLRALQGGSHGHS